MTTIRFFAAAADVVGVSERDMSAVTVGDLRAQLEQTYGVSAARVISRCSVLVDGVRAESDEVSLVGATLVDVLPPFAGG